MKVFFLKIAISVIHVLIKFTFFIFFPKDIQNEKYSSLRIFLINKILHFQNLVFKKINYPLNIYRTKNEDVYADVGGVLLDTSYTYRYFKITQDKKFKNQGEAYEYFFKKTKKNNFIDLGSHIGEIAIYIAKHYPNTKVLSVEASPSCHSIQERNILINNVKNIKIENVILSDKNSEEYTSDHFGTENYTIDQPTKDFIKIKSTKLKELLDKFDIKNIDFLKIDIEGSIPKLSEDLILLWETNKIRYCCLSIEKNTYESYLGIINAMSKNSNIYEINPNTDTGKIITLDYLREHLKSRLGSYYQSNRFLGVEIVFENKTIN